MLNNNETGLRIFDDFVIDTNLPKHGSKGNLQIDVGNNDISFIPQTFNRNGQNFRLDENGIVKSSGEVNLIAVEKDTFREWIGRRFRRFGDRLTGSDKYSEKYVVKPQSDTTKISVEEFFKSIKNSKRQMDKIDDRIESYQVALKQAEDFGQIALKEQLLKKIDVIRSESQLYAKNMVKVILEGQVVEFYKKSNKAVRIDWVKNFTRTIPEKILKRKKELDTIKVFDNYVIMHYDPNGTAYKMTEKEEEEAKKDPIMFGVIENSRKLYYIGDWVDNYCDLTLDDFIEKFGKEAIKKNNITANVEI